jgi:heme exporter protein D
MKKEFITHALLTVGVIPFLLPFIIGLYRMTIESWELFDFVILYSFIYWPTYVAGLICIAAGVVLSILNKRKKSSNQ